MQSLPTDSTQRTDLSPESSHRRQISLGTWWFGCLLFAAISALILTGAVEWEHYRPLLRYRGLPMSGTDRVLVAWLLWSKSLLPLLPPLLLAGGIAACGKRRLATGLLYVAATALFFWMSVDLVMQRVTGNHVLDFLPNLEDALRHATDRNHLEWAGDNASIAWQSLAVLSAVVISLAGSYRLAQNLAIRAVRRLPRLEDRHVGVALCTALMLAALASVPAQCFFKQPMLLRRLHTAMPVDMGMFVPFAASPQVFASLFGFTAANNSDSLGVRIVSVLPDPAGNDEGREQATLHNFASQPVSLDGWHLVDKAQVRHDLNGSLAPGESRVITFLLGGLRLNNDGDELSLCDPAGKTQHCVKYKGELVKYGGVIAFREEHELDEFVFAVNHSTASLYQRMHRELLTAKPADVRLRIPADNAPNVIYLVLESFRHNAVSPELMQRLDAWGQSGLRLKRHYAGSNSSHFGLFALLYGRTPLVYHSTLNAGVPPQTPLTLRASGYETTFITSGDCTGFRKMDLFLNEQQFDRVIIEQGENWQDWPQRDRRTLNQVRDLASRPSAKPQFVMAFLMSTHFPYAFPPEFDRFQPSGDDVTRGNWRQMDPKLLLNRYQNAALFLEEQLMELIESLDPKRNIIVVTGDHGESMSEDGALAHASRGSEIQTRVPMLIVGPGIPARAIDQPTVHTDLLPTLMHALTGQPVPVEHCHGRDLLALQALPDQVLLCPYRWRDPFDLVLVRADQRLQFKIWLDRARLEAVGFCNTSGELVLSPDNAGAPHDAPVWVDAFRKELERICR